MKELDEKGFVFLDDDGNAYRCCVWGNNAWLFRWHDHQKRWVSVRQLSQMDIFMLPHNLSEEQQEWYFKTEAKTLQDLLPDMKSTRFSE